MFFVGDEVIFVANDWHTALLPCYLKTIYQPKGIYTSAKVTGENIISLIMHIKATCFKFSVLCLLVLLGCLVHPQHCLSGKIRILRLLSAQST